MADHAASRQKERICLTDIVDGLAIVRDVEAGLAVRKVEWPVAFGYGVVAVALEQTRGHVGVDRLPGLGILAIARPEHTHLLFDLFVGDAGIIGHPALAGATELVEDLAR